MNRRLPSIAATLQMLHALYVYVHSMCMCTVCVCALYIISSENSFFSLSFCKTRNEIIVETFSFFIFGGVVMHCSVNKVYLPKNTLPVLMNLI